MTQRPQAVVSADLEVLTRPAAAQGISARLLIGVVGNVVVFVSFGGAVAWALGCRHRHRVGQRAQSRTPARDRLWSMVLGGTGAGALLSTGIELLQRLQPSRVADWEDLGLNTLGAFFGALAVAGVWIWVTWRERAP
jgi:glycopeptide antibiotics resistance protein